MFAHILIYAPYYKFSAILSGMNNSTSNFGTRHFTSQYSKISNILNCIGIEYITPISPVFKNRISKIIVNNYSETDILNILQSIANKQSAKYLRKLLDILVVAKLHNTNSSGLESEFNNIIENIDIARLHKFWEQKSFFNSLSDNLLLIRKYKLQIDIEKITPSILYKNDELYNIAQSRSNFIHKIIPSILFHNQLDVYKYSIFYDDIIANKDKQQAIDYLEIVHNLYNNLSN